MGIINVYGVVIIIVMMVSNILYFVKHKEDFNNLYNNKIVIALEQIGRIGCFIFLIINIPRLWNSYFIDKYLTAYLVVNGILVFFYILTWIIFFNKNNLIRAIALSVIPSIVFIFSGIMAMSILLTISAIIFAPCHITISCKNVLLKVSQDKNSN